VSRADAGLLSTLRESMAAGKALADIPEELRGIFGEFEVPSLAPGEELTALSRGLAIVEAKDPAAAQALRHVVLEACERAAAATCGISDTEHAVLTQVRQVAGRRPVPDRSGTNTVAGVDDTVEVPAISSDF
ncbi:MAG: hypothetical protein ACQERF_05155, partial [Actinomycetota bacterium]